MISGSPEQSFIVRWELLAVFYALLVLATVAWSVYHTVLRRATGERRRQRKPRRPRAWGRSALPVAPPRPADQHRSGNRLPRSAGRRHGGEE